MERFSALIGFVLILAIAFLLSNNKRAIRWKTVFWGLVLQIATAICVLKGTEISAALKAITPRIEQWSAPAIFIVVAIVVAHVAKRISEGARKPLCAAFGVFSLYFFRSEE